MHRKEVFGSVQETVSHFHFYCPIICILTLHYLLNRQKMHSFSTKTQDNTSQSDSVAHTHEEVNGESAQLFTDKRKETVAQREVQSLANNHAQKNAIQFKHNTPKHSIDFSNSIAPAQLQTSINHTSTDLTWKNKTGKVGVKVVANLDPDDKVTGSAVGGKDMYTAIDNEVSKYNNGAWARGHLLNHDLGGKGVPENLFPITAGANKRHANYVEYRVKDALSVAKEANKVEDVNDQVYYKVEVRGNPSDAQFVCDWEYQDKDSAAKESDALPNSKGSWVIPSKLRGPGGGDNPPGDPYFNSMEFPASKPVIWHHGDSKGGQAVDTTKVNWASQDEAPSAVLTDEQRLAGGYGYADGEMTDEEKAALQAERLKAKMATIEKHCKDKIATSIKQSVTYNIYTTLYSNAKYKRKLSDLKEDYDAPLSGAAESLNGFIAGFIRDQDLLNEIFEEHDDDLDLRPILPPKIRETDAYKHVVQTMDAELMAEEKKRQLKRGLQRLGGQGQEEARAAMAKVASIVRGDQTDKQLDLRDALDLRRTYAAYSAEDANFSKEKFKEAADRVLVTILLMTRNERVRVENIQPHLDVLTEADETLDGADAELHQAMLELRAIVNSYAGGSQILNNLKQFEHVIRQRA